MNNYIHTKLLDFINEKYKITYSEFRNNTYLYYFNSPKNKYKVKIAKYQGTEKQYYAVGFGVVDNEYLDYNTSKIVNENPYEIMDTLFYILSIFIKNHNVDGFIFSFTGDKEKNLKRLNLYKRAINKYIPNSNMEYIEGIYYLHLK